MAPTPDGSGPKESRQLRELFILLGIALVLVAISTVVVVRVLNQTDAPVETVRKIHIAGAQGSNAEEKELESDLMVKQQVEKNINATAIRFDYYDMTNKALVYLRPMSKLTELSLSSTKISNNGLLHLTELPLKSLSLLETRVTDNGMKYVGQITTLELLDLSATHITDRGLIKLRPLVELIDFHINNTSITDIGIKELSEHHPKLWKLMVESTLITDKSMKYLASLPSLECIDAGGTEVTVDGLECFRGHKRLADLGLNQTKISDKDIERLCEILPNLNRLKLNGTAVTDKGLNRLAELKSLTVLLMVHCKVSEEAAQNFHRKKPKCALAIR